MSLVLVVSRARPEETGPAAENHVSIDRWAQMLTAGLGDENQALTVDYAADWTDASAAAERAIRSGNHSVALIPVAWVDREGRSQGSDAGELVRLRELSAALSEQHPQAEIVLATTSSGGRPSFREVLAVLHPPDATDPRLLADAVHRAFGGDVDRFGRFVAILARGVPSGTQLALRGSALQGYSYKTREPFDAGGPGSSDLDIVLFGDEAMAAWDNEAFFIPGINTMPLGDESAWVAPTIEPARVEAQRVAGRPVNIQAMARWFMDIRSGLQGQPYALLDS